MKKKTSLKQSTILDSYQQLSFIHFIVDSCNKNEKFKVHITKTPGSSKALICSTIFQQTSSHTLFICRDRLEALYLLKDLKSFLKAEKVLYFPSAFNPNKPGLPRDNYLSLERMEVLNSLKLKPDNPKLIITTPEALVEYIQPPDHFNEKVISIKKNEQLDVDFAIELLIEYGFEREDFVYEPGQFSIRGGIIDVFSFAHEYPYRIELLDDKVESVRIFDPETQLSVKRVTYLNILPDPDKSSLPDKSVLITDYLDKENIISWIPESGYFKQTALSHIEAMKNAGHAEQLNEEARILIPQKLSEYSCIFYGTALESDVKKLQPKLKPQPSFNKNFRFFASEMEKLTKQGYELYVFSEFPKQIERIYAILEDIQSPLSFTPVHTSLHEGFIDDELKIACIAEHQLFNRYHPHHGHKSKQKASSNKLKVLEELQPGDYVTHIDHGVGVYSGLEKIEVHGKTQEAVRLVYSGNDLLYVNIHALHKISRYTGKDNKPPRIHKLGSDSWEKLKSKTKKKVKDIARDLIRLYAKRKALQGFAFSPDTYLQTELEASFIYEDTPDQAKATEDVKLDMEKEPPMDRLVCGDVGFGKTEVAIRAAFKAVADNKQVAVLVPTTILALQHFKTFSERLKEFPCRVNYLSRFKSAAQQKKVLEELEQGKLDIIIGTHRIVSKDIKFKDLGLLIIDEEQKFGVSAKEKLRGVKASVDTLTLSATPIPRTLQFSLMGARDLSIINTPPANRQAVETIMDSYHDEIIQFAIEREIERGGQVFFVHNRIKDIDEIVQKIRKSVTGVKVIAAHGQMESGQLEEIMTAFVEGFYDVLVSTSIIESGLDISNANTIIINQAQNFGLSDLYQMRGRVGRSNVKAYCYLLTPPQSVLTQTARKRLEAITEFTELGSGINIAMRDLDIRGAGNLLGAEQSGFIADVGFDMFHKILDEAVNELKQSEFKELFKDEKDQKITFECQIDTDLEILIPGNYVSNTQERLSLYHKLSNLKDYEALNRFREDLTDRFGSPPKQTEALLDSIRMKWKAEKAGIRKIIFKNKNFRAYFPGDEDTSYFQSHAFGQVLAFVQQYPQHCKLEEKKGRLQLRIKNVHSVKEALTILQKIFESEPA